MSCDPNDYTSAALILQGLIDERRDAGENVDSGEQWVARIQDRARKLTGELMARNAIKEQIVQLLCDNNLHEDPDCVGAMKQAAASLMDQFEMKPRDEEVPF